MLPCIAYRDRQARSGRTADIDAKLDFVIELLRRRKARLRLVRPLQLAEGPLHPHSLLDFVILPFSLVVAWLPWSRFYLSHYLQTARFATPIASALTAPFSAMAAAQGHYEVLILFALQIAGVFQFTGLLFRMALATCIAMVIGFAVGPALWLPPDAAIKYVFTMSVAKIVGAVAFRDTEIIALSQYLEDRLLGELLERDPLTGLKNRRSFDEHLQRIWMQAQRDSRAVAVIMVVRGPLRFAK